MFTSHVGKGVAERAEHVPDIRLMSDYTWNRALVAASPHLARGELGMAGFSAGVSFQSFSVGPRFQKILSCEHFAMLG